MQPPFHNERGVPSLAIWLEPIRCQDEKYPKCRACRLAPCFSSHRPLKWRTRSAILKPLSVSIVLTTTFVPACRQAMHEVQCLFGIGVAVVTRP
jgi:hypothetical protein